jgi:hypothetical protein
MLLLGGAMAKRKKNIKKADTQKDYSHKFNPVQESIVSSLQDDGWNIITFEKD